MTNGQLDSVLQHIRKLATDSAGPVPDRELLERFVRDRDEAAFAALVQRHGPMVLGVCRRILRHVHDAEDACQATFLVLARRAASIRNRDSLGGWLHGVAYRAAASLHRRLARRRAREAPEVDVARQDPADVSWREVRGIFDEELRRLPERFQAPLLLCCLEGKTRDEAAQELGWSLGTLRGRLERGRELLRSRLTRRGVTLSAGLLAALLSERAASAALPAALLGSIVRTAVAPAGGVVPARVAVLLEEVSRAMFLTRVKVVAGVSVLVGLVGLGAGLLLSVALAAPQAEPLRQPPGPGVPPAAEPAAPPDEGPATGAAESEDPPGLERNAAASRQNLKALALAMHNYLDAHGSFPSPAIDAGQAGQPPGVPMGPGPGSGSMGMMPPGGGGGLAGSGGAPGLGAPPGGAGSAGPGDSAGGAGAPGAGGSRPGLPGMPMGGSGSMAGMGSAGAPRGPGKEGKMLLSWRVALLPYLGEEKLYRQFRLDEAWDGPHNKALLSKMPKVYAAPGVPTREPYATFYQVFVGPHAAFEKHRAMRMPDITDGTSNTLLIAEAGGAVPWTKPEDLHFDEDEPLPELGGPYPGVFNAALADGSVHAFSAKADPDVLRAAITRDLGEVVDLERIEAPTSRREAQLRRENERLKQEVERSRAHVEELRREQESLKGAAEDPRVEQLQKDNARLEQLLRQSRDEAERLQQEIRRLKQRPAGGK